MQEIEEADFILALGADPVNEAPMLALAMRQAYRNGATIAVIDPRPISLPFEFIHLPVSPWEIDLVLSTLMKSAVSQSAVEKIGLSALRFVNAIPGDFSAWLVNEKGVPAVRHGHRAPLVHLVELAGFKARILEQVAAHVVSSPYRHLGWAIQG